MSKSDFTASERMKRWRENLKAAGWKSFSVWLPAASAAELDQRIAASTRTRRETLTETLQAGLSSPADNDAEREIARLRAVVRRLQAETAPLSEQDRETIRYAAQRLRTERTKASKQAGIALEALLERMEP